jgi:hypothetical protein
MTFDPCFKCLNFYGEASRKYKGKVFLKKRLFLKGAFNAFFMLNYGQRISKCTLKIAEVQSQKSNWHRMQIDALFSRQTGYIWR